MTCEAPINLGVFTVGEKPAPLVYQFLDFDGVVINLTGYTAKFVWAAKIGGTPTTGNATIPVGTDGKAQYTWTGAEFLTPGGYAGQFWVGNSTNRWASVKINWTVQTATGPVPNI